ncbi:MAG: hypothetical protein NZ927_05500 [Candidatus Calescibacterium sp.]|nr:hypothetical protein [Candidatus Calescibacterium sp.]MCX7734165.1 hypothetical protein [bacterium]MDW8088088.1 hypothetical protein [Candidatus Calescibacterium sp.]
MSSRKYFVIGFFILCSILKSEVLGHEYEEETTAEKVEITEEVGTGETTQEIDQIKIFEISNLFDHLHNKLVHFPIAGGIFAGIFEIISLKFKNFVVPTNVILGITAISSLAAFLSGKAIEAEYKEDISPGLERALELHETFGFITMIIYFLALVLKFIPKMDKIGSAIVILMMAVVGITGYLGGFLAH